MFASDYSVEKIKNSEKVYYAIFKTSKGDIEFRLFSDKSPVTVSNFIQLALGEKEWSDGIGSTKKNQSFYNGLKFHRVIQNFMIQGGCPIGNGTGGPGYSFEDEFHKDLKFDKPGLLAMANSGPNTNGSQFFITHVETPWLNDRHTIFGEIIAGQDIIDAIGSVAVDGRSMPIEPIIIKEISIRSEDKKTQGTK